MIFPFLLSSVLAAVSAQQAPSAVDLLNFFQISDLHIDALYSPEAGNTDYRCHANPEDDDEPHLRSSDNNKVCSPLNA
jgi:hypothetical protein